MAASPPSSPWRGAASFLVALAACTPAAAAPTPPPAAPPPPTVEPHAEAVDVPPPVAEPPAKAAPAEPPFPPAPFQPPVGRVAREGDGAWTSLVGESATAPSLLYRTTVHPDHAKPQAYVVVVAIDLRRVSLRLVAGTREPVSDAVPPERRPGTVPAADLPRLLAVFNGGFMSHHGNWGMIVGRDTFVAPRREGCAVAVLDHTVEIRSFGALTTAAADWIALRETPPCLVERGQVNRALLGAEKPRAWGMSETGGIDIRRSAVGVTDDGATLFYALGESVTPRQMADTMRVAGAVDAAELDVNWSYTRFLLYGPSPAGRPEVTATLIPKIKHAPRQYVEKPSERDFFYLARRPR